MLSQDPHYYTYVFNTSYTLHSFDFTKISKFASSHRIKEQGGLLPVFSRAGIYTKPEIAAFLRDLSASIHHADLPPSQPIGFVLSNVTHSIGLRLYGTSLQFIDINQYTINNHHSFFK